jgi:hypothetical protein
VLLDSHSEGFFPIASRYDIIPFSEQSHAVDLAQAFIVFYQ